MASAPRKVSQTPPETESVASPLALDRIDRNILKHLQRNNRIANRDIVSPSRIRSLRSMDLLPRQHDRPHRRLRGAMDRAGLIRFARHANVTFLPAVLCPDARDPYRRNASMRTAAPSSDSIRSTPCSIRPFSPQTARAASSVSCSESPPSEPCSCAAAAFRPASASA